MNGFRGSDEKIYASSITRIADLNRALFNYRILYVTVIAAFFTALSFFQSVADKATLVSFIDAYLLVTALVALATVIGVFVLSMLDAAHQELLEDCIHSAEAIEFTNECFTDRRIFARPSAPVLSMLINFAVTLFYAVPGAIIFGFSSFSYQISHSETLVQDFPQIVVAACPLVEKYDANGILTNIIPAVQCASKLDNYQVDQVVRDIIYASYVASVCFGGLFLLVHLHRIVGRFLRVIFPLRYPATSVRHPPRLHDIPLKKKFDAFSVTLISTWVAASSVYITVLCIRLL